MSDDLTRTLSRFTPCATLDRDTIIYQAGRASVPSPLRWKTLCAMLALSQVLTLLFVFVRPERSTPPAPVITPPPPSFVPVPGLTAWRDRLSLDPLAPLAYEIDLFPDDPPLRVSALLNDFPLD